MTLWSSRGGDGVRRHATRRGRRIKQGGQQLEDPRLTQKHDGYRRRPQLCLRHPKQSVPPNACSRPQGNPSNGLNTNIPLVQVASGLLASYPPCMHTCREQSAFGIEVGMTGSNPLERPHHRTRFGMYAKAMRAGQSTHAEAEAPPHPDEPNVAAQCGKQCRLP